MAFESSDQDGGPPDPEPVQYELAVGRAPRRKRFRKRPRLLRRPRRDELWWITIRRSGRNWAVLKERCRDRELAFARASVLAERIKSGQVRYRRPVVWRRSCRDAERT